MNWLVSNTGGLVNFDANATWLKTVLKLNDLVSQLAEPDIQDVFDLFELIGRGLSPELREKIKQHGLEDLDPEEAADALLQIVGEDIPEDYQILLTRFADLGYCSADMPGTGKTYSWPISRKVNGAPPMGDVIVQLGGRASAALQLQACTKLPDGVEADAAKPGNIRIGMQGEIEGSAKASISEVAVSAGVSGSAMGAVEFFFRHRTGTVVGAALAADFTNLASPFDVQALGPLLTEGKMAAIKVTATRRLSFDGKIGFAAPLDLLSSNLVSAEFAFTRSEEGRFEYLVRHDSATGGIAVRLRQVDKETREGSSSVGISIDATDWANRVFPMVKEKLGKAKDLLDKLKSMLPGGKVVRDELTKAIKDALDDSDNADLIIGALGLKQGGGMGASIREKVVPFLETAPQLWSEYASAKAEDFQSSVSSALTKIRESVDTAVADIDTRLLEKIPLPHDELESFQQNLQETSAKAIKKIRKKLEDAVKGMAGDDSKFAELTKSLDGVADDLGDIVTDTDERIAKVIQPIYRQLSRYQKLLGDIQDRFPDAAAAKIEARFSALMREEESDSIDLEFVINDREAGAQDVLSRLLKGDIQSFLQSRPAIPALSTIRGKYERYKKLTDQQAFSFVLFGLGFSGGTTIAPDARVVVNAQGDIQIMSNLNFTKRYKTLNDNRELSIVDAFELATAQKTKSISLAVNLSLMDESMTRDEAREFFRSVEKARLLAPGATQRVLAQISDDEWGTGRLDIGMSFTPRQLHRMLDIADASLPVDRQPVIDRQRLLEASAREVAAVVAGQPPEPLMLDGIRALQDTMRKSSIDLGSSIEAFIVNMDRDRYSDAANSLGDEFTTRREFELLSWGRARHIAALGFVPEACQPQNDDPLAFEAIASPDYLSDCERASENRQFGLVDAIEKMRAVYLAGNETTPKTDVDYYITMQHEIGKAFKSWFVWSKDISWWFLNKKEVRPLTLALFRTLGVMSREQGHALRLSASLTVQSAAGTGRRINLT